MYMLLAITTGFVAGLYYSKGKINPVACAVDDASRAVRWTGRQVEKGWRRVRDMKSGSGAESI
ncbi:MAG TPA: hypothetical protein PKE26_05260 [Kiritimatiellia bacterium]|nr:hypothetical protein [Kiritimatiellia bacterium]HMO98501.1 hypothetical protein [Kiritimatiellia bacterium]HMP95809.1 hypothetical protein [Kiritimatiellia bacterium]